LLYRQGVQRFHCYLKRVSMPVRRISSMGGALQAIECQITLAEMR